MKPGGELELRGKKHNVTKGKKNNMKFCCGSRSLTLMLVKHWCWLELLTSLIICTLIQSNLKGPYREEMCR